MKKEEVLWVLYAFSLFCSFHFDWVSQYRDFFAVYFLVASSVEVKMNVTRLFCLLHGNN